MSEPLEQRLLRVLRRYLAPELASRVAREVVRPEVQEPPREEWSEMEKRQAHAALMRVGKVRVR